MENTQHDRWQIERFSPLSWRMDKAAQHELQTPAGDGKTKDTEGSEWVKTYTKFNKISVRKANV